MLIVIVFAHYEAILSGENNEKMPTAKVVVSEVTSGTLTPETAFIGTVYYPQISDIASEVSGKVDVVSLEEGDRVKKGQTLVKINTDLLRKNIETKKAFYEQVLSDLELATRDLKRIESLYKEDTVSEQVYDEYRFKAAGLNKKAASVKAELGGLRIELQKKTVRAPFNGVVIKKQVDVGEWLAPGTPLATIARDDIADIIVYVPEVVLESAVQGMNIKVTAGGKEIEGKLFAIIPQGDISTRTFPLKIRIKNTMSLIDGMEAKVVLPGGKKIHTFVIDRDAIIHAFGETVVFACIDSRIKRIPVKVTGYEGTMAGIDAPGLEEGMRIVVKGNERVQDEQVVQIINKDER